MTIAVLPIANGFYNSESLPISAQECTNWYVNLVGTVGLNQETLLPTPGLTQLATSGSGKANSNRGSWVMNEVPYFVNGASLYRLESDKTTLTNLGTITGTGRVEMSDNGTQLFILAPGSTSTGYIFTADPDTLTTIVDADFNANGEPQTVRFVDGYFSLTTSDKKFIVSALNDGLSYDALDFGSAEANPDKTVTQMPFRNQLYICGSETIEAFQNIGGADFPFQRTGLFIMKGVFAPGSIVNANDAFMFIGGGKGESPAVWAVSQSEPQKISTTAIDVELQKLTEAELNSITSWSYAQKGAYFTGFNLPNTTFVFDTITGKWHERKSQITTEDVQLTIASRVASIAIAYGEVLCGDSQDGRIGQLDDEPSEYGSDIIRTVSTQPFQNNMQSLFFPWIELTVESGTGNATETDPVMRMSISRDGGKTYSDSRTRAMGKIGEYNKRLIWRRNGRIPRFAVLKFTTSSQVKTAIIQLTADVV